MSIEESILKNLRQLPLQAQREVLGLTQALRDQSTSKVKLRSLHGLWEDLKINLTEQEIATARREMWGHFPREIQP